MKNNNTLRYWAVIPAAGLGLRMGANKPKQYLMLQNKPILAHSITTLSSHPLISKVVVVLNADDRYWSSLECSENNKVITTLGGTQRSDSVLAGLGALQEDVMPNDWVIVHDAVRPCLTHQHIDQLIHVLSDHPVGGLFGTPVRDTLKRIDDNYDVMETINRDAVWCAQTPQMFRWQLLHDALIRARTLNKIITDDACALELQGHKIKIVQGDVRNIKITYPEDMLLAEQFLMQEGICFA